MQVKEAIILAGGQGTRLRNIVPGIPKCLAPVNGRPFLFYLINYLRCQGIEKIIFSLGYKSELVQQYLSEQFATLDFDCVTEREPLGTGGAILASCYKTTAENVLVLNGDSLYKFSLRDAAKFHFSTHSSCTVLLKPMQNFDRYGLVELNDDNSIKSFREKQFCKKGLISSGYYLLHVKTFMEKDWPEKFSFEKDFLEKQRPVFGTIQDEYFIDIGTPEDYEKAQSDFKTPAPDLKSIDKSWTLFLDRDGVINMERKDKYVLNWSEFEFLPGAREAISIFKEKFGRIIIVSNQRCVEYGMMTEETLLDIHDKMMAAIELANGRIDRIYYCTNADPKHPFRKPNPGMAFAAARDFPEIDFQKSIIAGNKTGDMLFGRFSGMHTVFIATTNPETAFPHPDIDFRFSSLIEFAKTL